LAVQSYDYGFLTAWRQVV